MGCKIPPNQQYKNVRQMHETPRMLPPCSCSSIQGEQEAEEESEGQVVVVACLRTAAGKQSAK